MGDVFAVQLERGDRLRRPRLQFDGEFAEGGQSAARIAARLGGRDGGQRRKAQDPSKIVARRQIREETAQEFAAEFPEHRTFRNDRKQGVVRFDHADRIREAKTLFLVERLRSGTLASVCKDFIISGSW